MKVALITGVTGQDGSYLSEFLLSRGYEVHGVKRRGSSFNTSRIDHLLINPNFKLHYGDVTDGPAMFGLISKIVPNEIYNLAAMSHVAVSFEVPQYTANATGLGILNILEAVRLLRIPARIYQASSSEMFGAVRETPQNELTPFHPRSPYGVAKTFAHYSVVNYREAYGIFAVNGILFNHESPRRGETFVTSKIVKGAVAISKGKEKVLRLGNLSAERDWGHAKDYVRAMWMMLQQTKPEDYVIATGVKTSVKEFAQMVFDELGLKEIYIIQDLKYMRPSEVDLLLGDSTKARQKLGWEPQYKLIDLIREMIAHENTIQAGHTVQTGKNVCQY